MPHTGDTCIAFSKQFSNLTTLYSHQQQCTGVLLSLSVLFPNVDIVSIFNYLYFDRQAVYLYTGLNYTSLYIFKLIFTTTIP